MAYIDLRLLKLHNAFDPRRERASLLRLDDLSSNSNQSSSYSYLISLGRGDLSNIFDKVDSKVTKVTIVNDIAGERDML